MNNLEILEKDSHSLFPIFFKNRKELVMRDVPMSIMLKDNTGKIEPFHLAYNAYLLNEVKYEIHFSQAMKFRKEIYYQIFNQIILDIYDTPKYRNNENSGFITDISTSFKLSEYDIFKLVPISRANNKDFCWNSRIIHAKIGKYNYFASNFRFCEINPKRRKGFLIWREAC